MCFDTGGNVRGDAGRGVGVGGGVVYKQLQSLAPRCISNILLSVQSLVRPDEEEVEKSRKETQAALDKIVGIKLQVRW